MTPYHRRCPVVAHHEAGHVIAVTALGYKLKSARVFTMLESSQRDPFETPTGMLFVNRGEVEAEDIFPPDVQSKNVPAYQREALCLRAIDMAICCLAGPIAQARYSKRSLSTVLNSSAATADKAVIDELGAEWFDCPMDLWVCAIPKAYDIVGKGWNNLQLAAGVLLQSGELRGTL